MPNTSSQPLSPEESAAIENYLTQRYIWPVEFSLRLVVNESADSLRKSVVTPNHGVFTLQGAKLYHQAKFGGATPLNPLENAKGLYLFTDSEEGDVVRLELVRVTDLASAPVAA